MSNDNSNKSNEPNPSTQNPAKDIAAPALPVKKQRDLNSTDYEKRGNR